MDEIREIEATLTPDQIREATVWRILRSLYISILSRSVGRKPMELTVEDANRLIGPWTTEMQRYHAMMMECVEHAKAFGSEEVRAHLHATTIREFDSHDCLEQVISPDATVTESPLMPVPRHGPF